MKILRTILTIPLLILFFLSMTYGIVKSGEPSNTEVLFALGSLAIGVVSGACLYLLYGENS